MKSSNAVAAAASYCVQLLDCAHNGASLAATAAAAAVAAAAA
jgi:hypothetical protein